MSIGVGQVISGVKDNCRLGVDGVAKDDTGHGQGALKALTDRISEDAKGVDLLGAETGGCPGVLAIVFSGGLGGLRGFRIHGCGAA